MDEQEYSAALQSLVPEPTEEERKKFAEEAKRKAAETKDELPTFPDYPLADFVKEHKLDGSRKFGTSQTIVFQKSSKTTHSTPI